MDINGDGKLTPDELNPQPKAKKPASRPAPDAADAMAAAVAVESPDGGDGSPDAAIRTAISPAITGICSP